MVDMLLVAAAVPKLRVKAVLDGIDAGLAKETRFVRLTVLVFVALPPKPGLLMVVVPV
jgi:hypothetical protein